MQIKSKKKNVSGVKKTYPELGEKSLTETILPTLNDILFTISPKFKENPKSVALISSIVYHWVSVRAWSVFLIWQSEAI